jgi:fatty acid desaturase
MSAEQLTSNRGGANADGSMYAKLLREVQIAGLLQPKPAYYTVKIAINTAGMLGTLALFLVLGDSWFQLMTAALLAFFYGQCAIIGHDAGHRQISRSRSINSVLGFIHFDLFIGIAFGWWIERHRRHHTYPNDPERDPDIINEYVVFTPVQAQSRSGWRRKTSQCQAVLFFPGLFLLQAYAMRITHVRELLKSRRRGRVAESCLLFMHVAIYMTAIFLVLPPVCAIVFMIVHQGLFGVYLGGIIAPNHKGMEIQHDSRERDFLMRQLHSSRNIHGGLLTETIFGGLNYQIEHHLFPSMPTPNLRNAKPIVRAFCQKHGLAYVETSLFESYRTVLTYLHAVGRASSSDTPDKLRNSGERPGGLTASRDLTK